MYLCVLLKDIYGVILVEFYGVVSVGVNGVISMDVYGVMTFICNGFISKKTVSSSPIPFFKYGISCCTT